MPADQDPIVTIKYRGSAQLPVYVAGEFTDPPWQPLPMDVAESHAGTDITFTKSIAIPVGHWQYKFRIGEEGDHWECNPEVEIGIDGILCSSAAKQPD
jgi:hypothetical protein